MLPNFAFGRLENTSNLKLLKSCFTPSSYHILTKQTELPKNKFDQQDLVARGGANVPQSRSHTIMTTLLNKNKSVVIKVSLNRILMTKKMN